ncbi:MAG: ferrous iron transporter B [Spirochaetales bacterium]|nr:ferrous iron transporter B [Spirochaetales bacterium]
MKNVLFTGLPNSGKTHIFNGLTGSYDIEANYAYTTMDFREETLNFSGEEWRFTDSPGFHGLFIHSEEELLLRDYIYREKPDVLVHCVDTGRFRQGMLLALDLASLQIPMVLVLNNVDNTSSRGEILSGEKLAAETGVPVVEFDSFTRKEASKIRRAVVNPALLKAPSLCKEGEGLCSDFRKILAPHSVPYEEATALLILQNDETLRGSLLSLEEEGLNRLRETGQKLIFGKIKGDFNAFILRERQTRVEELAAAVIKKRGAWRKELPERLAALSRHPLYGLPLLMVTLITGYLLVVNLAGFIEGVLSGYIFDPLVEWLALHIGSPFLRDMLVGDYGIITLGLIAAIATVLPVLTVFFFFFAIIEDTGYLPNLMVLLRRTGEKLGLSGKSLMPLLLGFGCKTMATLSTKTISNRKEKLIAIFLIGFAIPCSAQMGLNMAILGQAGIAAFLVALFFLVLAEMGAGMILNRILPEQNSMPFIQELPPFRFPRISALFRKTGFRIMSFLKESLAVFMIAAVCLYLLDVTGLLLALKNFVSPVVVHWLGLPIDMVEGLLLILARNEAGAGYILRLADSGALTVRQTILAVVLTTMFVPCFANMVAMVKESGRKTGILMILAINISSLLLAGGLNFLIQLVWKGAN